MEILEQGIHIKKKARPEAQALYTHTHTLWHNADHMALISPGHSSPWSLPQTHGPLNQSTAKKRFCSRHR